MSPKISPTFLFLDTSVLEQLHFDFTHPTLKALAQMGESGSVSIVYTEMSDFEVKEHIKEFVHKAYAARRKHGVLNNAKSAQADEETLKEECLEAYETFLSDTGAGVMRADGDDCREVLEMFFKGAYPFGPERQPEFKDAFSLAPLFSWVKQGHIELYVCTNDKAMKLACNTQKAIFTPDNLQEFLNIASAAAKVTFGEECLKRAKVYFDEHQDEITKAVHDRILNISFDVMDPHGEVTDVEVESVEFHDDFTVLSMTEEGSATVQLNFDCGFEVHISGSMVVTCPVDRDEVDIGSKSAPPRSDALSGSITFEIGYGDYDSTEVFDYSVYVPSSIVLEVGEDEWEYDIGEGDEEMEDEEDDP